MSYLVTPSKIKTDDDRCIVTIHHNGVRTRFSHTKTLAKHGVPLIYPNKETTLRKRQSALDRMCYEIEKLMKTGWRPPTEEQLVEEKLRDITLGEGLALALKIKKAKVVKMHYDKLSAFVETMKQHFPPAVWKAHPSQLTRPTIQQMLNSVDVASNDQYMRLRSHLRNLLNELIGEGYLEINPVSHTSTRRHSPKAHIPYTDLEMQRIFDYWQLRNENMHLCIQLTYGSLLRPHREIRNLRRGHFSDDLKSILLTVEENKSKRTRAVGLPEFVVKELFRRDIDKLGPMDNIFSRRPKPPGEMYFATTWMRAMDDMKSKGLLKPGQTIYSFRHTGAIWVWNKYRDLRLIQQLMCHGEMSTTEGYLRGIGAVMVEDMADKMPQFTNTEYAKKEKPVKKDKRRF